MPLSKPAFRKVSLALAILALQACASTPDPAKVCTSEWISTRADKAISQIESRTKSSMKTLVRAAESWAEGRKPGPFQLLALSSSMKNLEKELLSGSGMRDLKTLASTCNDPQIISKAMTGFMRDQGLPENLIAFIEGFDRYKNLIKPLPNPENSV